MLDKELEEYRNLIGKDDYKREYNRLYRYGLDNKTRYSEEKYENSKERLDEIKEKYKNGVTESHIKEWFDL